MQSPTSVQDFPQNPKRRLELQRKYNAQLQQEQQQQNCDDMICNNEEPPFKKQRPGIATNFLYKFAELAAYTSAFASEAINTITGSQVGRESTRHVYDYDEVFEVGTDDEYEENDLYDHKLDKKGDSVWIENEEPPPPYDNSWSMPSTHDKMPETEPLTTPALSTSPSQRESDASQKPSSQQFSTKPRRRQIRVRRRRVIRRKSSSTDMTSSFNASSTSTQPEQDGDDIFLKFNCRLTDMIAEGKAALNSKAEITDVEMMIAEEKEKDERIMRELGIQTINRRARRLTSSSNSSDYDYLSYSTLTGSGGYSNQSSPTTYSYDYGFNGTNCYYSSPTGYYPPDNGFSAHKPTVGRTSPTRYGSSGGFNSFGGSFNKYGYGSSSTGSPTTNGYEGSSNGFGPSSHNFGHNSSGYGSNMGFGTSYSRGYY